MESHFSELLTGGGLILHLSPCFCFSFQVSNYNDESAIRGIIIQNKNISLTSSINSNQTMTYIKKKGACQVCPKTT